MEQDLEKRLTTIEEKLNSLRDRLDALERSQQRDIQDQWQYLGEMKKMLGGNDGPQND